MWSVYNTICLYSTNPPRTSTVRRFRRSDYIKLNKPNLIRDVEDTSLLFLETALISSTAPHASTCGKLYKSVDYLSVKRKSKQHKRQLPCPTLAIEIFRDLLMISVRFLDSYLRDSLRDSFFLLGRLR